MSFNGSLHDESTAMDGLWQHVDNDSNTSTTVSTAISGKAKRGMLRDTTGEVRTWIVK